jgi:hypothetical protein
MVRVIINNNNNGLRVRFGVKDVIGDLPSPWAVNQFTELVAIQDEREGRGGRKGVSDLD